MSTMLRHNETSPGRSRRLSFVVVVGIPFQVALIRGFAFQSLCFTQEWGEMDKGDSSRATKKTFKFLCAGEEGDRLVLRVVGKQIRIDRIPRPASKN